MAASRLFKHSGRLSTIWLLLFVLAQSFATRVPPNFILDLDKPPSERWAGAVDLVLKAASFESGFALTFDYYNKTVFNNLQATHWKLMSAALLKHFPEQAAELKSIALQFQNGGHYVSFEYLAGWVYSHELMHSDLVSPKERLAVDRSCTGVVVQNSDGNILHGANMDQSPKAVRDVTLQIDIQRNGSTVISGVDWYWFTTGVTRAVRKGVAALSEDWRDTGVLDHIDVLDAISSGALPQVFAFRTILLGQSRPWSEGFIELLRSVKLAAPMYIIAAGTKPGQGLIMARSAFGSDGEVALGGPGVEVDQWFIAQSNYEPWWPDPKSDPRKTAAVSMLAQFGQGVAGEAVGMFAVLSTFPVLNPGTAYSTVMRPSTGHLSAFVRDAACPATPADQPFPDPRYCSPSNEDIAASVWQRLFGAAV